MNNHFRLRYLPLFYDDFSEIIDYISNHLMNPQAADELIDAVEEAILQRLPFADSFPEYPSKFDRKHRYYRIDVKNYTVFYVVIHDVNCSFMEIRRILYNKRNFSNLI